jgi:hypothetical protein
VLDEGRCARCCLEWPWRNASDEVLYATRIALPLDAGILAALPCRAIDARGDTAISFTALLAGNAPPRPGFGRRPRATPTAAAHPYESPANGRHERHRRRQTFPAVGARFIASSEGACNVGNQRSEGI